MPGKVVEAAHKLFGYPLVCYFRLGTGTAFPLHPVFTRGDYFDRDLLESKKLLEPGSHLLGWVSEWDHHFFRRVQFEASLRDEKGHGFGPNFLQREDIHSMCILPVGTQETRVGILLLFYRETQTFSRMEMLSMLAFARDIAPHLARAEFMTSVHRGFARPQFHFHSIMAEEGLGHGTWEYIFNELLVLPTISANGLGEQVQRLRSGLKRFLDRARASEAVTFFGSEGNVSLKEELEKAFKDLKDRFPGKRIIPDIPSTIESENDDLKLALFILVTEIARNAFIHGKTTTLVRIRLERNPYDITLYASDDGMGFCGPTVHS